jgi:hypothetical protein
MYHMGALWALWEVDGPIRELHADNRSHGRGWHHIEATCSMSFGSCMGHMGATYAIWEEDCTIWGSTQHLGAIWKPPVCNILEAEGTMADVTTKSLHMPYDGNMGAMCALWELHHHVGAAGSVWELLVPYGSHMQHTGTV